MKKFFQEFKKFITRGNVVDMAVGVIVGSSFTAIVNGLSNYVLKPIINWLLALMLGKDALSEVFTFLKKTMVLDANGVETSEIDLANSIYIDWGAFINAIINFFLVALVLFSIVKIINNARDHGKKLDGDYTQYVNPLMGTQSSFELSTGNTYPAIAMPWGMNFWTPRTNKILLAV